jgi:hypothetical protein
MDEDESPRQREARSERTGRPEGEEGAAQPVCPATGSGRPLSALR